MAETPASPGGGGSYDSGGDQSPKSNVREQDMYLPIANISRIMKKALPANGNIAKDAKDTVQECVSEFISFITSEASDKCKREKRKTVNGDDLIWAMEALGYEDYIDPLKIYLARYREMEGDTKGSTKSGDASAKEDVHPSLNGNAQPIHQGSFSQGVNYVNSQENSNAYAYQNKSIDSWDDICTLFASDRATGDGAEQHEESASAMEMENEVCSGSNAVSGESNKRTKRDRLADAVTRFAESFNVYVSKAHGPPRPSGKDIYDVLSAVPYISRMQILKGVKSFMNGTTEMFDMLNNLPDDDKLDWVLLHIDD